MTADANLDRLPKSGTGPALTWCACAAISQVAAALIALSVWLSPEFANDFENGTRTADAAASAGLAIVLSIIGILFALAALFDRKATALACGIGALLLVGGCATGLLALPLLGHYG